MYALKRSVFNIIKYCNNGNGSFTAAANLNLLKVPHNTCNLQFQRLESTSEVLTLDENEIDKITEGNADEKHKLQVLLLETEILRQEGKPVPSSNFMKLANWKELLSKESRTGRRRYLEFLFKIEKKKVNKQAKKEIKKLDAAQRPPIIDDGSLRYDLGHNNMFLRFYDSTINYHYNNRLIQAMQFGQKIVVDCGYHDNMTKRENINCAKQLMMVFAENRAHKDPFDLHFCNLEAGTSLEHYFNKFIPTMYDPAFPINVHKCSYLDLYPKSNLVYLTPHCREELHDYNHDSIYVIGGIVDKVNNEPLSLAKAKREGIPMAKLPLDQHLHWGAGSGKSLTLNQVISILLDQKCSNDWKFSLRHVPKRKISDEGFTQTDSPNKNSYETRYQRTWKSAKSKQFDGKDTGQRKERLLYLKNILHE